MLRKKLKIDPDFRNLIRPLNKHEYIQLEKNIAADGCRDPIVTWNGIIIDGHNRYEICNRLDIPYEVKEMEFECREAVTAWICANQLGRRNISLETRKFLIGMQYESEKVVATKRNAKGINQHTPEEERSASKGEVEVSNNHKTARRIGDENHVSYTTVQKYAIYTRALEEIGKKEPALVPKILSGQYKISHRYLIELSQLPAEDVKKFNRRIERDPTPYIQYKRTRSEIQSERETDVSKPPAPSVKDMPKYDPDAEISSLALTIPSWKSSIERTKANANLSAISPQARDKVVSALTELRMTIAEMLVTIEEEKWKT